MQLDLLAEVKEAGQDYEWYPTAPEMFACISRDIVRHHYNKSFSVLDIGAGDGRSFEAFDANHKHEWPSCGVRDRYAIEKSERLIAAMPESVCVIGTDFHKQTLIDKQVDVVFCNPPYSEYVEWTVKIIREANAENVYLVIPHRWASNREIDDALAARKAKASTIGAFDFTTADRKARAVVDILHISFARSRGWGDKKTEVDPFDLWFSDHFKIQIEAENKDAQKSARETLQESAKAELVHGRNYVQVLSELYRGELNGLLANYQAVGTLDGDVLRELGVSLDGLKDGLKLKIKGLKTLYWQELFNRMKPLTDRLTAETRKMMLEKLQTHMSVDFDESNAYAVMVWALKNANHYIDEQLKAVYRRVTSEENVRNYKSNRHMTKDSWRYLNHADKWEKEKHLHHYALEYRIVLDNYYAIGPSDRGYSFDYDNGLHKNAHEYIGDILTICHNLGFIPTTGSRDHQWESNRAVEIEYKIAGNVKPLASIKAFKNGNIHVKFAKEVIAAINTEAARLFGWIKTAQEATEEAGIKDASRYWGKNFKATKSLMLAECAGNGAE